MNAWIVSNKFWLLLGVAAVFNCYWVTQHKKKLGINGWIAIALSIVHMLCAVLFAKLFAFMEGAPGGMSLYGGHFFLPVLFCAVAWVTKRSIANACDVFTIPSIVVVACARMNCVLSGCCLGTIIPGTDGWRWPTREVELILYVVLFFVLRKKISNPKYNGKLYPIYMISYGTFRFIVEWFRESDNTVGFIHVSHFWSIIAIMIGILSIYLINRKASIVKKSRKSARNVNGV